MGDLVVYCSTSFDSDRLVEDSAWVGVKRSSRCSFLLRRRDFHRSSSLMIMINVAELSKYLIARTLTFVLQLEKRSSCYRFVQQRNFLSRCSAVDNWTGCRSEEPVSGEFSRTNFTRITIKNSSLAKANQLDKSVDDFSWWYANVSRSRSEQSDFSWKWGSVEIENEAEEMDVEFTIWPSSRRICLKLSQFLSLNETESKHVRSTGFSFWRWLKRKSVEKPVQHDKIEQIDGADMSLFNENENTFELCLT